MQKNIHPQWHDNAKVICSCGNTFTTGSTQEEIKIDICNKCHPFFTGEMKFVDRQGRVDKFNRKRKQAQAKIKAAATKTSDSSQDQDEEDEKSYQQILREKKAALRQSQQSKPTKK